MNTQSSNQKKQSLLQLLGALTFAAMFTACDSTNPELQAPPEVLGYVQVESTQSKSLTDPKVNILFVVDNSGSMKPYQDKMAANIEQFANQFFANTRLNYRIGVVPVYDSKYKEGEMVPGFSSPRKMNPLGELVALKGLDSKDNQSRLFITRDTINPGKVLKETVAIGVQWGPEAEESFSPVLAVMDPELNQGKNAGFYEEDASLAVIFLTDADDVTLGLSGEEFYQRLVAAKGGDKSKILIAAAIPKMAHRSASCRTDGRGPVQQIPALLQVSGGLIADLCSNNFGTHLASFGQYLVQRVAGQKISLEVTPDISTLKVLYGLEGQPDSEMIELQREKGDYIFVPGKDEIIINPNLRIQRIENAKIFILFIPVNYANHKNGRLKEI
jgi:hypothetical protein